MFMSMYDKETLSEENIRDGLTKVSIFYESLSFTQLDDVVKLDGVGLLAVIGGFAGLFLSLSLSLMSFVEILDIFVRFLLELNGKKL